LTLSADIVAFSCAIYNENLGLDQKAGWENCVSDMDSMLKRIAETTGSTDMVLYLSGDHNFRYDINPNYKANRKDAVEPVYRQDAKSWLIINYGAILCDGIEADDALGIAQTEDTIICSIDKDLLQIPGRHYNWRKDEWTFVEPLDGLRTFYRQILTGDRTDNIFGLPRFGPVTAAKHIDHLEDEMDMFDVVQTLYNDDARLLMNGKCLHIMQKENDFWEFPTK
jgi:5'-3' exonuclease